jgi:hypothetical protein
MTAMAYEIDGSTHRTDFCVATAIAADDTAADGVAESKVKGKERGEGEGRSSPEERS